MLGTKAPERISLLFHTSQNQSKNYGNTGSLDESDSRKFRSATYLAPDSGGGV